ncbi:MAG: hypothetical protein K9K67_12995 [Bacteriovoracaceae bacterium]|nr:hypothetical protein [Bacteriovoracaceae bacterium]
MKTLVLILVLTNNFFNFSALAYESPSAYYNPNGKLYRYECGENLALTINYSINKANISFKGNVLSRCENRDVVVKGEMLDYGEGRATVSCHGGEVELLNDYDELVLRPSTKIQKIYQSMKEYEYFCEEI